jgi:hypothetical protein
MQTRQLFFFHINDDNFNEIYFVLLGFIETNFEKKVNPCQKVRFLKPRQ